MKKKMNKNYEQDTLEDAHLAVSNLAGTVWMTREENWKYSNLYQFLEHTAEIIDIYRRSVVEKRK